MNFFSQKQKPIRHFFFILTNRFDQIEIIFEQFRFWLVRYKLYFEKKLWKPLYFFLFSGGGKNRTFNDFKNDPERRITASRDFLIAAKITLVPKSRDYSLVLKTHVQKFNPYFRSKFSKSRVSWKKVWTKPFQGKRRWEVGSRNPVIAFHLSRTP